MSKQRCNLEGAGNQTKKKGYSSSLPSFSLRNGIMILLYLYMYALYASDSAKSGRRTSLVLVSTVSNNPVGNRQSTFMDMSAAKKKDLLFLSSSSLLFLGKKKKREWAKSRRHWRWMVLCPVRTPHVCYTIILESVIKGPVYLPTNPTAHLKQTCTLYPLHMHLNSWTYNTGNGLF